MYIYIGTYFSFDFCKLSLEKTYDMLFNYYEYTAIYDHLLCLVYSGAIH